MATQSYIGSDPQSFGYFQEAIAAGLVPDSQQGEIDFSIMWTSRVEDLLRAGKWRFLAWQHFREIPSFVTSPTYYITPREWAILEARDVEIGQWAYKFQLSPADIQSLADAFVWAIAYSPLHITDITAAELIPATISAPTSGSTLIVPVVGGSVPLPTAIVSPGGTIAPQGFTPNQQGTGWIPIPAATPSEPAPPTLSGPIRPGPTLPTGGAVPSLLGSVAPVPSFEGSATLAAGATTPSGPQKAAALLRWLPLIAVGGLVLLLLAMASTRRK